MGMNKGFKQTLKIIDSTLLFSSELHGIPNSIYPWAIWILH